MTRRIQFTGELSRALMTLTEPQGRVARSNARARVRRVLRRVEALLDREFPVIPKATSSRRTLTRRGWEARMRARNWVRVGFSRGSVPSEWLSAGLPSRKSPHDGGWWIPWWGIGDGHEAPTVARLRELKKSPKARAALWTARVLTQQAEDGQVMKQVMKFKLHNGKSIYQGFSQAPGTNVRIGGVP